MVIYISLRVIIVMIMIRAMMMINLETLVRDSNHDNNDYGCKKRKLYN